MTNCRQLNCFGLYIPIIQCRVSWMTAEEEAPSFVHYVTLDKLFNLCCPTFSLCHLFSFIPRIVRKILLLYILCFHLLLSQLINCNKDQRRYCKSALENRNFLCFLLILKRVMIYLLLATWGICYLPGALAFRHL